MKKNKTMLYPLLVLGLIVFIGGVLRFYGLSQKSLWHDEVMSVIESESMARIWGSPMPLYSLILHFSRYMGTNEFILRFPSAVFGILTIVVLYYIGKLLFGIREGLVGAFLLSISIFHIYYSQEARAYTLLAFLSLLSLFFFYKSITENRKASWLGFTLSTLLTLFTHYFGVFVIFVEVIFFLLVLVRNKLSPKKMRRRTRFMITRRILLMFSMSVIIILALYFPFFYSRFGVPSLLPENQPSDPLQPPLQLSFLFKLFGEFSNGSPFGYNETVLCVFIFFFLCGCILAIKEHKEKLALLLLWIAVSIILLFWASTIPFIARAGARVYPEPRYLIFVLPVYLLLTSTGITSIVETTVSRGVFSMRARARRTRKKTVLLLSSIAILLIVMVLGVTSVTPLMEYYRGEKQDWRAVGRYLEIKTQPDDVIVIEPAYAHAAFSYYFDNQKNLTVELTHGSVSNLENIYHRNSRIWFATIMHACKTGVIDWVDRNSLWVKRFVGGLRVYFISQHTPTQFKAAIFTNLAMSQSYISWWETALASVGASTTTFDDAIKMSSVNMSEFDLVAFIDIKRPLVDAERSYLEESLRNGLTIIVSGLSPYWLAGGTTDLTPISPWFGATVFSEAPSKERWGTRFTTDATEIMGDLDIGREYAFYTDLDWSTPTAAITKSESVMYAYRENDGKATLFTHSFGNGTVIFSGARYGFRSPDAEIIQRFLQALIRSVIG